MFSLLLVCFPDLLYTKFISLGASHVEDRGSLQGYLHSKFQTGHCHLDHLSCMESSLLKMATSLTPSHHKHTSVYHLTSYVILPSLDGVVVEEEPWSTDKHFAYWKLVDKILWLVILDRQHQEKLFIIDHLLWQLPAVLPSLLLPGLHAVWSFTQHLKIWKIYSSSLP
jgi:hypothetical protein